MDKNSKFLLSKITPLHDIPQAGIYSIRENGKLLARNTDEEVNIVSKTDKEGIDVFVKSGTQNKSVHIPVLVSMSGFDDLVYNDFYIGDNCDILIVAGCGIHNPSEKKSSHNGIHTFHIGKNSKVKYVEKHFAFGNKKSKKILNPVTEIEVGEKVVIYGDMTGLSVKLTKDVEIQVLQELYAAQHALGVVGWVEIDGKVTDQQKLAVLQMKSE